MKYTGKLSLVSIGFLAIVLSFVLLSARAAPLRTERIALAGHRFTVEIAATDATRERGLMFRSHLANGHGMLFVFSDAQRRYFWMKNTLIPLDILFFDAQRQLINIAANTPPCKTPECPSYPSAAPAEYVLELNAGVAAKLRLKPGDQLSFH